MSFIELEEDEQVCSGESYLLSYPDPEGVVRIEWSVLAAPAASVVVFDDYEAAETNAVFPNDGLYTVRRCRWTDAGEGTIDATANEFRIGCQDAAIVGDVFTVFAYNCAGTYTWSATGPCEISTGEDQVVVVATGAGGCTVTLECTGIDPNTGVTTTQTATCDFVVYEENQNFETSLAALTSVTAEVCGTTCECVEFDILVGCEEEEACLEFKIGVTFKGVRPALEIAQTNIVTQPLVGTIAENVPECQNPIDKGCGIEICCDPQIPAIIWNDLFNCGWSIVASNSINGTKAVNAATCNYGKRYCGSGATTLTLSGPAAFADTLILYGHSLTDATITTTGIVPFGGGPKVIGVYSDGACMDGYTRPVTIFGNNVPQNLTEVQITIETEGDFCIENIVLGTKFFPEGLRDSWANPFNGTDRKIDIVENACGINSFVTKRQMVPMNLVIDCLSQNQMRAKYGALNRYLTCNPLYFYWSINNYENEVFYGVHRNAISATPYEEGMYPVLRYSFEGYISQMQPKDFI